MAQHALRFILRIQVAHPAHALNKSLSTQSNQILHSGNKTVIKRERADGAGSGKVQCNRRTALNVEIEGFNFVENGEQTEKSC